MSVSIKCGPHCIIHFAVHRQLLTSGGFGTMGYGLPAAIGDAVAKKEQTVICFTGDGSIQMNI
jgi:acetolactate synthase I/II/III large subunit